MKKCPRCGEEQFDELTECLVCGQSLDVQMPTLNNAVPVDSSASTGKLMGDKNVIAGDVHVAGSQDTYHSTTNVINQDETKRIVVCHICGKNTTVDRSVDCPVCHQKTCEKCFDFSARRCSACAEQDVIQKVNQYMRALTVAREDGKISIQERQELDSLRVQLGLSREKTEELEKNFLSGQGGNKSDTLSMFETASLEKARKLLWHHGKAREALNLINGLYKRHQSNEDVLSLLIEASEREETFSDKQLRELISSFNADFLGAKLALVRSAIRNEDPISAEQLLNDIEFHWPDNLLVTYHKILSLLTMAKKLEDNFFIQQAQLLLEKSPEPQNKLERSWLLMVKNSIAVTRGEGVQEIDEDYCSQQDLYRAVASRIYVGRKTQEKLDCPDPDKDSSVVEDDDEDFEDEDEEEENEDDDEDFEDEEEENEDDDEDFEDEDEEENEEEFVTPEKSAEELKNAKKQEAINELLSSVRRIGHEKIYFKDNFDFQKLENALKAYVLDPRITPDDVIIQIDETVWGSANEGCIITENKIFAKEWGQSRRQMSWDTDSQWGVKKAFCARVLILDGREVFSCSQVDEPSMEKLVVALNDFAKNVTPITEKNADALLEPKKSDRPESGTGGKGVEFATLEKSAEEVKAESQLIVPESNVATQQQPSPKSRSVYIVLALLLGTLGIHNFYAGYIGRGVIQLLMLLISLLSVEDLVWVVWIWVFVEICAISKDASGRKFR